MASRIVCAGDPLIDCYFNSSKSSNTTYLNAGGVLNTYRNLCALINPENVYLITPELFHISDCVKIYRRNGTRLNNPNDNCSYYKNKDVVENINKVKPDILVLSDYNRGALSAPIEQISCPVKCTIVDSKYKTLNKSWISTSKFKIWKCTKEEFDKSYASSFDWTIITDEDKPITLLSSKTPGMSLYLPVPIATKVKSTIGAGDSFLAALGAELFLNNNLSTNILLKAIQTAISVSQDVIKMPRTSITRIRLE